MDASLEARPEVLDLVDLPDGEVQQEAIRRVVAMLSRLK